MRGGRTVKPLGKPKARTHSSPEVGTVSESLSAGRVRLPPLDVITLLSAIVDAWCGVEGLGFELYSE